MFLIKKNLLKAKSNKSLSRSLKDVSTILGLNIAQEVKKRLKGKSELQIIDMGCGVGRSLWELSDIFSKMMPVMKLYGVYFSALPNKKSLFYENEKRLQAASGNPLCIAEEFRIDTSNKIVPRLFNNDACKKLPFKSNSIDLIYSTNAFHFFENKIKAIEEISRILNKGGLAIINIDRTDDGFWPASTFFPRLRIYNKGKFINAKKILQDASNDNFTLSIVKTNSYGTGKNSYILKIKKHSFGVLSLPTLKFDKKESISLNAIRSSTAKIEDIPEYKKLVASGEVFAREVNKEYFGGYLSCYNLN